MLKVLITGITGFIGSKIAEVLCQNHVEIIGLKRINSNIFRCKDFANNIHWIDIDGVENWKEVVIAQKPNVIIHSAWIGVEASERDDYPQQAKNITFLIDLLFICKNINVSKFIFLGSQAEYGVINGKVSEDEIVQPSNAYGAIKMASLDILKAFCSTNDINWVWLRIFSIFGEKENENWLIPSIIKNIQNDNQMDFTYGEQKYAYLYILDLANIIYQIITKQITSGIYNISSDQVIQLRTLIENIRNVLNENFILNFGAIPYRSNQSMHIEGDISKIVDQIGPIQFTNFNVALQNTINYYKVK